MQQPDHLQTIHVRQVEIKEYAIRLESIKFLETLAPSLRFRAEELPGTVVVQTPFKNLAVNRLVINDENFKT
jgi:hypothetical protein